jgi:hypothetical protein
MLRRRADGALVFLGVVVFAAGSVVLARPFVTRRVNPVRSGACGRRGRRRRRRR